MEVADTPLSAELTEVEERASYSIRRAIGAGILMLSIGGGLGALYGARVSAFSPTDVKFGPHDATLQLTHDHQETIDLGPLGNLTKQVNLVADTGFRLTIKGIPDPPAGTSESVAASNILTEYNELIGNKRAAKDIKDTLYTRIADEAEKGAIVGGAIGLGLLGLGLGAWSQMSDKRRQAFRDAMTIESGAARKLVFVGALALAIATSEGYILPTPSGHHITQDADPLLADTPLAGFAVHGEELKFAINNLGPIILGEWDQLHDFYQLVGKNFDNAFKNKFPFGVNHDGVLWVQTLSDNHCNVWMDDIHGQVARAFDNDLTLDTGDMTLSGRNTEELCVSTEAAAITKHNPEAVVMGNHDSPTIAQFARKHGMIVLENDKLTQVGKFKLMGASDVYESPGNGVQIRLRGTETDGEMASKLVDAACKLHPDILLAHEKQEALPAAEIGCVPEVRYGHDHKEADAYIVNQTANTIAQDAGTSGGAAPNNTTLLTLKKVATETECEYSAQTKLQIGCYVISANTYGSVEISDFIPNPATYVDVTPTGLPLATK